jgi:toxin ParE1/3/4
MPSVIYAPEADDDLEGIVDFIARDNPTAAREWLQKLRETCEALSKNPGMGEAREGFGVVGCRSFSAGSYVVFFRPVGDGIEVSRVIHGSRDMRNF